MEFRGLDADDEGAIREIARRSMESAFEGIVPESVIETAIDTWYAPEAVESYLSDGEMVFVIAEIDDEVVGFGQSHVIDALGKGRVLWVHVDPEHRGIGIPADILDEIVTRLHDRGIGTVTAVVLDAHEAGMAFYDAQGFERLSERTVDIGGESFREVILRERGTPPTPLELRVDDAGEQFYVDLEETDRGSVGAFCAVYRDPDRERRYGWFCTACESLETAMDTMGRIRCVECENTRKPTRWDAAYL